MARSRNIKPGFFLNEDLVELPYEVRLLFVGLWCLADRDGRLENRPKKIKMQLFPADELDIHGALTMLASCSLITIYSVDSSEYIQVNNFLKHQHPHQAEKKGIIPAPDKHQTSTVQNGLIPDSFNPITDSLNLIPDSCKKAEKNKTTWFASEDINLKAWSEYEQHRKDIRKPMKDLARTKAANILKDLSHEHQQACVDKSIASGWAGLFPDKQGKKSNGSGVDDWLKDKKAIDTDVVHVG